MMPSEGKLPLQVKPPHPFQPMAAYKLKAALPFVSNDRAVLIHRPRYATIHDHGGRHKPHMSVGMWCGASHNSEFGMAGLSFIADIPLDRFLCANCEKRAVEMGRLPPADQIVGRHVCVGGVRAYNKCLAHGAAD
jgi:hypothetical protein